MLKTIAAPIDFVLRNVFRHLPLTRRIEHTALWWGYHFQPKLTFATLKSGLKLKINSLEHQHLLLYYFGTFEPDCLETMKSMLKPGGVLLDVGTNIGLFSMEGAKKVGPTGKVISIEAAPKNVDMINVSIAKNGFSQVEVHSCGASDNAGTAILTKPPGGNNAMMTLGSVNGSDPVEVPLKRIDDIVGGRRVDFIKMDIEGSEYRALLGAKETILRSRPPILIELNETTLRWCGSSTKELKQLLFDYGYRGRMITTGKPVLIDDDHVCDECIFSYG